VGEGSEDQGGALRAAGGVLLGLGALVVFIRRGEHGAWTDFELLLTLAIPSAALFALAVAGRSGRARTPADPSRAVLLVTSVLLSVVALFQLLHWAGASTRHVLYDAAVLVVAASIGILGARRAGAPYAILLSGLALLVAWMLVWLKIISHPSADTVRELLLAGGAVLLIAAAVLELLDRTGAREIATAGGIGAVAAGLLGVIVGSFGVTFGAIGGLISASSSSSSVSADGGIVTSASPGREPHVLSGQGLHIAGAQTAGWNIYLLVVSLAFVWLGARSRSRGLGYVGALGLLGFLISVGAQLTRLEAGHDPSSSVLWWPLVLVMLGLAGLLAPLLRRRVR
jgi:hypothetical protein